MKKAYVTFLASDHYLPCLMVLCYTLQQTHTTIPLYCVVTPEVPAETLEKLKKLPLIVLPIDKIDIGLPKSDNYFVTNWEKTFSKLSIWKLTQFDKIVYLDADTWIVKNIDNLFDSPHMSAVQDGPWVLGYTNHIYYNAGVMVLKPNLEEFNSIMTFIAGISHQGLLSDQLALWQYYKDWKDNISLQLPWYYNVFAPVVESYEKLAFYKKEDICIYHFIGVKPFEYEFDKQLYWHAHYDSTSKLYIEYMQLIDKAHLYYWKNAE